MSTASDPRRWLDQEPVLQRLDERTTVLRDDVLPGGTKLRFLPFLTAGHEHVVFGGPFCGGAPLALSCLAREGLRVSIFYAARKELHPRQKLVLRNGARAFAVSPGYMSNVQAKARRFAQEQGALFLPLGFDVGAAEPPFIEFLSGLRKRLGSPDQVWCVAGSGMLARCIGRGFPDSEVCAVTVGLKSRHEAQQMPPNVTLLPCPYDFAQETKAHAPFPSCPNYDRKGWEQLQTSGKRRGRVLFYNVLGPSTFP